MSYIHKIFDAISDSTLRIFRIVASKDKSGDGTESNELMREANLDPKLYYQRVSKLLNTIWSRSGMVNISLPHWEERYIAVLEYSMEHSAYFGN